MRFFDVLSEKIKRYDDTHNFICDVCEREVFAGERVCDKCFQSLPLNNGEICPLCGRKVGEAGICLDCKEKPLALAKVRSALLHEGEGAALVLRFKKGAKYLARTFAYLCKPIVEAEFSEADFFTFVPMTKKTQKRRGYNQSEAFAEMLARACDSPVVSVAEKKRETEAQKTLGRRERESNLEGCFRVTNKAAIKDKKILIVDDTLTTGATLSELARVLKKAGAKAVYGITATSVQKKYPFGKTP